MIKSSFGLGVVKWKERKWGRDEKGEGRGRIEDILVFPHGI